MKKNSKLQQLKAMINASTLECIELRQYSVQVYNLNEYEEYSNIYKVEKVNGRYYMFDIADNKYLISRQRDAEWFAGEFLEFMEYEENAVTNYVNTLKEYGKTTINEAFYCPFTDRLDAEGIEYRPIAGTLGYCNQGYVICSYEIVAPQTTDTPEEPTEGTKEPTEGTEYNDLMPLRFAPDCVVYDRMTDKAVGSWRADNWNACITIECAGVDLSCDMSDGGHALFTLFENACDSFIDWKCKRAQTTTEGTTEPTEGEQTTDTPEEPTEGTTEPTEGTETAHHIDALPTVENSPLSDKLHRVAQIAAHIIKTTARKTAQGVALLTVFAIAFGVLFALIVASGHALDAIETAAGGVMPWGLRFALCVGLLFTVIIDLTSWVEINAIVLFDHLHIIECNGKVHFIPLPFSIIGRVIKESRAN